VAWRGKTGPGAARQGKATREQLSGCSLFSFGDKQLALTKTDLLTARTIALAAIRAGASVSRAASASGASEMSIRNWLKQEG
jgi:hypothetical protein